MKFLRVTMPDGSQWDIPADFIASNRATNLAVQDPNLTFAQIYHQTMAIAGELKEWAENNMNWDDVSHRAERVAGPTTINYQEGWVNGPKLIIEKP